MFDPTGDFSPGTASIRVLDRIARRMGRWVAIALSATALIPSFGAGRNWTPEDQLKVRTITDVLPSPDAKLTAWTENAVAATGSRLLVNGKPVPDWTAQATILGWSPGGRFLYFAAGPAAYRSAIDPATGSPQAPERISRHPGTSGGFRLSPDASRIALVERIENKSPSRVRLAGVARYSERICIAPADGKGEAACVIEPGGYVSNLAWSPDSGRLAFERRPSPYADDSRQVDLVEADATTGRTRVIASTGASETSPLYSPDGKLLAFLRSDDPPLQPGDFRVQLFDRASGQTRALAPTDDRWPSLTGWSPDASRIYFTEARGTRNVIAALPVDGGPPQLVFAPDGVVSAERVNARGDVFGFSLESAGKSPEAFVFREGSRPTAVSSANAAAAELETARTEVVWWRSKGNLEVEGLLTYPIGYQEGRKYPMGGDSSRRSLLAI